MIPREVAVRPSGSLLADLTIVWPAETPPAALPTTIRGPHCQYSRTLAATWKLATTIAQSGIVQQVRITDPCYWTPELPFLYDLQNDAGQSIASCGLRNWQTAGDKLKLDGRRIVLRGALLHEFDNIAWNLWRECQLTLLTIDPPLELCAEAAMQGVPLVVTIEEHVDSDYLRGLAACPAVLVVLLGLEAMPLAAGRLPTGPQYGLAVHDTVVPPPEWAQVTGVVLEQSTLNELLDRPPTWPLLVFGPSEEPTDCADSRRLCEQLQATCAPWTNLSGYFVV
jgi:hypothetical protein